jgi:hypothetical protein
MAIGRRFTFAALAFCSAALNLCDGFQRCHIRSTSQSTSVVRGPCTNSLRPILSSPSNDRVFSPGGTRLFSSELDDESSNEATVVPSLWLFAGIPILSLALPILLQFKLIVPLIVLKRAYIYTLAASVLVVAGIRGSSDSPSLGTRLIDLTREILPYNIALDDEDDSSMEKNDTRFQEMAVLDEVDDSTQAVGLPLIVVSSLVASLFFVLLQNSDVPSSPASLGIPIQSIIQPLITISNAAVISLFARAELRRLLPDDQDQNANIATAGSLVLTGLAFVGPAALVWPIQNSLCACLAISVARAIQIPRFVPIVLALSALVAYDVVSVGIQLVNLGVASMGAEQAHQQVVTSTATSAASSAMGAVAMAKTQGSWQPGLFQVRLRGIATDLLGLGDAVFPSLLSTFCLRLDKELGSNNNSSYFIASLVGFAVGCLACELVPGISDTGLPALLFLVPSMLTAIVGLAAAKGDLSSLLAFDPASDADE